MTAAQARVAALLLTPQSCRNHKPAHWGPGCEVQPGQASSLLHTPYLLQPCNQPSKETCYQHHACCMGLTYCTLLCAAWDYVDAAVAYIFGLDESKYQWAVYTHQQQLAQVCNWQAGLPCSKNTICCAHFRYAWWRPALENPGSPARRWQLAGMHA